MSSPSNAQGLNKPITVAALAAQVIGKPITVGKKVYEVAGVRFFQMKEEKRRWSAQSFTVDLVEVEGDKKTPFQLRNAITFLVEPGNTYLTKENLERVGPLNILSAVTPDHVLQTVANRIASPE